MTSNRVWLAAQGTLDQNGANSAAIEGDEELLDAYSRAVVSVVDKVWTRRSQHQRQNAPGPGVTPVAKAQAPV